MSSGQWALPIFIRGGRVHFFVRTSHNKARSLCGREYSQRVIFEPGNFERCRKCVELRRRRAA